MTNAQLDQLIKHHPVEARSVIRASLRWYSKWWPEILENCLGGTDSESQLGRAVDRLIKARGK